MVTGLARAVERVEAVLKEAIEALDPEAFRRLAQQGAPRFRPDSLSAVFASRAERGGGGAGMGPLRFGRLSEGLGGPGALCRALHPA